MQVDDDRRRPRARNGPSTWACSATSAETARDVAAAVRGGRRLPATDAGRGAPRRRGPWPRCPLRRPLGREPHRPADAVAPRSTRCCPPSAPSPWTPATSWATPAATWPCPTRPGFCFTQAFQSIGLGLATAHRGRAGPPGPPRRRRRSATAGFLMGIAELETAVRLGLGLLVVVYDDAGYGAEVHHFADADHGDRALPRHRPRRDRPRLRVRRGRRCASTADLAIVADLARRPARPPAGGRREDHRRRPVLVAGRGVPGALRDRQVSGTRRSRRRAGRSRSARGRRRSAACR